jgi:hypothetical protein
MPLGQGLIGWIRFASSYGNVPDCCGPAIDRILSDAVTRTQIASPGFPLLRRQSHTVRLSFDLTIIDVTLTTQLRFCENLLDV